MNKYPKIGLQTKTPYGWWWIGVPDSIMELKRDERVDALKTYLKGKTGYRIVATDRDNSLNTTPEEVKFTC